MMGRSLGAYLFGGVLALLLGSASGFGCLTVASADLPICPCDASEFTFTLVLSSAYSTNPANLCVGVDYAVVTLDFTVQVVSASVSGHDDTATTISGTAVEFVLNSFADFSTATFKVELDTCDEAAGTELLPSAGYYDSLYTDSNPLALDRLTLMAEAPSCAAVICSSGDVLCMDPHMQGLRGQRIDWSGVDGGWYSLIKDDVAGLHINVRLTAPLPAEFPDRQLVTGLSVTSEGHSLVIEVKDAYDIRTDGCPEGVSPCLANGGLRIVVDGDETDGLLGFSREVPVADGALSVSASNLPAECRQFGGERIWARKYEEMLQSRRALRTGESFEEWILSFHKMAAPGWCALYVAENGLADLQSAHAILKIDTSAVTVRLNAGVNLQGGGETNWDGRVLPDMEFWQMDVGLDGLDIENPVLSGILGETARPVYDASGKEVMEGFEAFRGTVEDYRVSGPLGTHFALFDEKERGRK